MDPDFLTSLTSMFGPKPGVDPFALGGQLATDPTQAIPALAQGGPPPAKGQSITDWVQSKMPSFASNLASAAGSQPAPSGIPTGDVTGASAQPPMPRGGWIPPNPAMKAVPKSISPTAPSPLLAPQRPDLSAGAPQPDAPYLNLPGLPSRNPMTADANVEPQAAPPGGTPGADFVPAGVNQRRSVPDIQAPLTNTPPAAAAPTAKVDPAKLAAVLKSLGGTLAGVKAPPAPEAQRLSTPGLPHPGAMPGGTVQGLIAALGGLQPQAQAPLRLGNALYAGWRGIY
jgi:hypothetical protein